METASRMPCSVFEESESRNVWDSKHHALTPKCQQLICNTRYTVTVVCTYTVLLETFVRRIGWSLAWGNYSGGGCRMVSIVLGTVVRGQLCEGLCPMGAIVLGAFFRGKFLCTSWEWQIGVRDVSWSSEAPRFIHVVFLISFSWSGFVLCVCPSCVFLFSCSFAHDHYLLC